MTGSSGHIEELYHLPGFHEPFSAISHLVGAVIFVVLGVLLLSARPRRSCPSGLPRSLRLLLHLVVFHERGLSYDGPPRDGPPSLRAARPRRDFHPDRGYVYAGQAGLLFHGWLRWGPLLLIWAAAVTGITLKTIFFEDLAEWLGLSFYLSLGWFGIFSTILLTRRHGFGFVKPLLLGGLVIHLPRWDYGVPRLAGNPPRDNSSARAIPPGRSDRGDSPLAVRLAVCEGRYLRHGPWPAPFHKK